MWEGVWNKKYSTISEERVVIRAGSQGQELLNREVQ